MPVLGAPCCPLLPESISVYSSGASSFQGSPQLLTREPFFSASAPSDGQSKPTSGSNTYLRVRYKQLGDAKVHRCDCCLLCRLTTKAGLPHPRSVKPLSPNSYVTHYSEKKHCDYSGWAWTVAVTLTACCFYPPRSRIIDSRVHGFPPSLYHLKKKKKNNPHFFPGPNLHRTMEYLK